MIQREAEKETRVLASPETSNDSFDRFQGGELEIPRQSLGEFFRIKNVPMC